MMLKRIMTFAAMSAMTVAMAGSAIAAETTKQLKPAAGSPNKIKFTKEMKIYNVDDTTGGSAKAPDVKYTYTIAGSTGGGGKTPVMPNYVISQSPGKVILRNYLYGLFPIVIVIYRPDILHHYVLNYL